jgi:hypothetical protein
VGDEARAVGGTLARLVLPARLAEITALHFVLQVVQNRVIRLLIGKAPLAGLAGMRPGLNVPLVHELVFGSVLAE